MSADDPLYPTVPYKGEPEGATCGYCKKKVRYDNSGRNHNAIPQDELCGSYPSGPCPLGLKPGP